MEKESRPQLYDRELQKKMMELEEQLSALLAELSPAHASQATEVLQELNKLRRNMFFS